VTCPGAVDAITEKFELVGARARVSPGHRAFAIDVRRDRRGEFFELRVPRDLPIEVLDVRRKDRHLVLRERGVEMQRFLCGHDERHWFAAAIRESAPVTTVEQAKDALKPVAVREGERRVRPKHRNRRRNPAYVRQGEWFFVPAREVRIEEWHILHDEPLSRGLRSTPHVAEEAVRMGGESVYVSRRYPNGLSTSEYEELLRRSPKAAYWGWRVMTRNPDVYVRGRVTHPDHRTVTLHRWHRVFMNTESEARARENVAFLD
jgi:hypothetical protein